MQVTKPAQSCAGYDQLDDGQDYFVDHVKEVLGVRAPVERISEKYFDHHQVLWKSVVRLLQRFVRFMRQTLDLRKMLGFPDLEI
jgi:hypothetical protein